MAELRQTRRELEEIKWRMNEGMDRMDVARVKEDGRCMAGGCIVALNEDLGHCVPANL